MLVGMERDKILSPTTDSQSPANLGSQLALCKKKRKKERNWAPQCPGRSLRFIANPFYNSQKGAQNPAYSSSHLIVWRLSGQLFAIPATRLQLSLALKHSTQKHAA
jgi:hypothetical protein